ncbi:MAG TPA: sugar transferase [Planctomycetota bacterium]|nr:sugar transferase [Planctomycetota bacterium]
MSRSNHRRVASSFADLVCLLAALSCGGVWSHSAGQPRAWFLAMAVAHVAIFVVVWSLIANRLGTYRVAARRNRGLALRRVAETWAATWGVAGLLATSAMDHPDFDIWFVLGAGWLLLSLNRLVLSATPLGGDSARPRTIVVGACASARGLTSGREAQASMEFVGAVPFSGEDPATMPHLAKLGPIGDLAATLRDHRIELALVSPSDKAVTGEVHRVFHTCDEMGLSVHYFPSFLAVEHLRVDLAWNAGRPGLAMSTPANQDLAALVKRSIDVIGACAALIVLMPVFLACALAVKLTSRGPVFFRQIRVGRNGEHFNCLKFRTMRVGADAQQNLLRSASIQDGPAFKVRKDPRVTPIGRVLRKFSLDELPQFLNVLVGDMSIVGPRPPIPTEVEKYAWWQRRRISVKPGLTCVWQVYGRNSVSFKRWVEMDLYYIDNWSLWLDLKLIAHTVRVVVSGTGM